MGFYLLLFANATKPILDVLPNPTLETGGVCLVNLGYGLFTSIILIIGIETVRFGTRAFHFINTGETRLKKLEDKAKKRTKG